MLNPLRAAPGFPTSIVHVEFTPLADPPRLIVHFRDRFGCCTDWWSHGYTADPAELLVLAGKHVRVSAAVTKRN